MQAEAEVPDRVPVMIWFPPSSFDRKCSRFLVPPELTIGHLSQVVRRRLSLSSSQALFLLCNDTLPRMNDTVSQLCARHGVSDGALQIECTLENAFGSADQAAAMSL